MSLEDIREQKTSKGVYIIIGMLLVGMAGFGTSQFGTGSGGANNALLETDQAEISIQQYNNAFRYIQQQNPDMPAQSVRSIALASLKQRLALADYVKTYPLAASDAQIDDSIRTNTNFFDNGQFSEEVFRRIIPVAPEVYRDTVSQDIAMQSLQQTIATTGVVSDAELQPYVDFSQLSRDIIVAKVARDEFSSTVSSDEIQTFYDSHKNDYMTDELVDIEYIDFLPEDISSAIAVSDTEALATISMGRKATYLIFGDNERAQAVYQAYQAGKTVEQLQADFASSIDDSGDLGVIAQTASKDSLIAQAEIDAIYALDEVGQLTAPMETENGVMMFALTDKGQTTPTAAQIAAAKKTLQAQKAAPQITALQEKLNHAVFETSAPTLKSIADYTELPIQQSHQLSLQSDAGLLSEKALKEAIANSDKAIGVLQEPVTIGDRVVIYRLTAVTEAKQKSLDEVESVVKAAALAEKINQQMSKAATALLEKTKAEGLVAASSGAYKTITIPNFDGSVSEADKAIVDPIAAMIINQQSPALGNENARLIESPTGDKYVYVTSDIRLGSSDDDDKFAEAKKRLVEQLTYQTGTAELGAFIQSITERADITDHSAQVLSQ